ncbi:CD276 antigen homolog [Archocentrus centrarchus]|uniref:CD276 antigen homolog n=1 Tax=Archocentrus centrarchus TaxID=63155 RepID=UPI0011EA40CD|nr:CD276 antigen homolog [Archocentrus centrarchus]
MALFRICLSLFPLYVHQVDALAQIHLKCPEKLEAGIGERVILSCATDPQISLKVIEWMKNETEVHVYRKGGDDLEQQGKDYKDKTSVFEQELSTGNCSLQLLVSQSHNGTYQCFVREGDKDVNCSIKLIVRGKETTSSPLNTQIHLKCPEKLEAGIGERVILSCATDPQISLKVIEWMKNETEVHVYRKGGDVLEQQGKDYKDKTSVFEQELSTGNCSLQLLVSQSHNGTYQCFVREGDKDVNCSIKLIVRGKETTSSPLNMRGKETTSSPLNNTVPDSPSTSPIAIGVCVAAVLFVFAAAIPLIVCCCKREPETRNEQEMNPLNSQNNNGDVNDGGVNERDVNDGGVNDGGVNDGGVNDGGVNGGDVNSP